jgi:repressor LexA
LKLFPVFVFSEVDFAFVAQDLNCTGSMKHQSLTLRQQEIYDFLEEKITARGYGPTVREIGLRFGIKSPNGVVCHLKALQKKGLISREAHMSRAIQLSQPPQMSTELPFLGQLTEGALFPNNNADDRLNFGHFFESPEHCCLRIRGWELQGDLIDNNDVLIVHRRPTFRDGDVAVIAFEDGTMGVRRLYQEVLRVRLERVRRSDNPQYLSRVVVIGTVVGMIRQY